LEQTTRGVVKIRRQTDDIHGIAGPPIAHLRNRLAPCSLMHGAGR
jgi:hypothetical protein